jgi:hypothetical protein
MGPTSRVDLIKLTHIFCKLDRFINAYNNCLSAVKRSSLQTRVSKLMPKKFYEIDSWFAHVMIKLARDQHSSLFCLRVSVKKNSFNIDTYCQCYYSLFLRY